MENIKLSDDQKLAAEYSHPGAYAIKGIAGSGKTTVGIHRIPFLLKNCIEEDDQVLVITFHKTLVNYLEHLVNEQISIFQSREFNFSGSNWSDKLKVISIDDLMDEYYDSFRKANIERYKKLPEEVSKQNKIDEIFDKAIEYVAKIYPDAPVINSINRGFLLDEVQFLISDRIETLQFYQGNERKGRENYEGSTKNLENKSAERKIIYELRTKYISLQLKKGIIDRFLKRRLALIEIESKPPKNITHLVVDEAQDLDKVRFDFLKQFPSNKRYASATFLYDPAQSIHPNSWLGNGHTFSELGIEIKSRSLHKNFRTTFEIQDAAISILDENEKKNINIELTNKSNVKPSLVKTDNKERQKEIVIDFLKTLIEYESLKDIIIAGHDKNTLKELERDIKEEGIECSIIGPRDRTFGYNKVRLMTLQATKGLECKAIILVDLNEGIIPNSVNSDIKKSRERKLLYVAMTRATKYLYLISSGETSSFIKEIESEKLLTINQNSLASFVPVEDPTVSIKIKEIFFNINAQVEIIGLLKSKTPGTSDEWGEMISKMVFLRINLENLVIELENIYSSIKKGSFVSIQLEQQIKKLDSEIKKIKKDLSVKLVNPISEIEIKESLKEKYPNFNDETITTLTTAKYLNLEQDLKGENSNKRDWGTALGHFSKAQEIEYKIIFSNKNWEVSRYNKSHGRILPLTLSQLILELKKKGLLSSDICDRLKRLNSIRNDGQHEGIIIYDKFKEVSNKYFKENGLLQEINNLHNL